MAIQCTLCGTALKDDARFCNICGTLVPSHPFSPKTTAPASLPPGQSDTTGRVIREQIAQQPPARPRPRLGTPIENSQPPPWMNQLESDVRPKLPSGGLGVKGERQDTSSPVRRNNSFQEPGTGTRTNAPGRELRVKVWEQAPTNQLAGDVDQLDTVPLATPMSVKSNKPVRPAVAPTSAHQQQPWQQQDNAPGPSAQGWGIPSGTSAQKAPTVSNTNTLRQTPPPFAAELRATRPKQRKSRKPLGVLLVILLLLLIGGGIGTWIVLYAPFTVASITQPQQTLTNTQVGVSLQYPSGWTVQVDTKKSTVKLFDSSHTAQFSIVSNPANGGDVSHYLQQEASQLSMTSLKSQTTQTFAGTSWQELQGNVLINGASYTETLFAVVHQQNMYSITQLAPQATYIQEEQYVFSSIRAAFQFVA